MCVFAKYFRTTRVPIVGSIYRCPVAQIPPIEQLDCDPLHCIASLLEGRRNEAELLQNANRPAALIDGRPVHLL